MLLFTDTKRKVGVGSSLTLILNCGIIQDTIVSRMTGKAMKRTSKFVQLSEKPAARGESRSMKQIENHLGAAS